MGVVEKVVTKDDAKKLYKRPPNLSQWLPWREYISEEGVFLLEDDNSVGILFEVTPVAVEARGDQFIAGIQENLYNLLTTTIPQESNPYILSTYCFDEANLDQFIEDYKKFVWTQAKDERYEQFTEYYLDCMERHAKKIANPEGFFFDNMVTKQPWKGVTRRTICCLYRRVGDVGQVDSTVSPADDMNSAFDSISNTLKDTGVGVKRLDDADLYNWLFPWFNEGFAGYDKRSLLENFPYPKEEMPFGLDLTSLLFTERPESVAGKGKGYWRFGSKYHKAITIDNLRRLPVSGQVSAELPHGDKFYALLDKLPDRSMLVTTVVFVPKERIEAKITTVKNNAKGDHHDARATLSQSEKALEAITAGNYLFPTVMTVLFQADTAAEVKKKSNDLQSLFMSGGFGVIKERDDQLPINQYIKALPFNYEYELDKDERRNRLVFASHLSKILPFYGRSCGTRNTGLVFFNRGAEQLSLDFIHDRVNNAFMSIIGPPGSGKSNLINYLLWYLIAVHNARIFVLEKGGSFQLTGELAKDKGLTVNQVTLKLDSDYALSPFADAFKLVALDYERASKEESEYDMQEVEFEEQSAFSTDDSDDEGDVRRDYLGELELSARIMITGGEEEEERQLMRSDRVLIRNAIKFAGLKKYKQWLADPSMSDEDKIVLPSDVCDQLELLSVDKTRSARACAAAERMAESMRLFCDGAAKQFFDRPGKNWEEADLTILEFGVLTGEGYEAELALAFTSLMNRITYLIERDEHLDRPTIIIGDEAHLFLKNKLLAIYLVKGIKMYRKLGAWLWLATQNLDDFSEESHKLLSMFEWLVAMSPPKKEVDAISKFRDLTPDQKIMLRATRKEPGKYTEGVILSDQFTGLFRNVPPSEIFALGQTEKDEKVRRAQIMKERNISAYQAALVMAEEMASCRE